MNFRMMAALILVVALPTFLSLREKKPEKASETVVSVQGKPMLSQASAEKSSSAMDVIVARSQDPEAKPTMPEVNPARLKAAQSAHPQPESGGSGVPSVSFELLGGFPYELTDGPGEGQDAAEWARDLDAQFPKEVMQYRDQEVELLGYIIPIDFKDGKVISFVLVSSPMACCFGVVPKINEWVHVKISEGISSLLVDIPLKVRGNLRIGADIQDGAVLSIYRMDATSVRVSQEDSRM